MPTHFVLFMAIQALLSWIACTIYVALRTPSLTLSEARSEAALVSLWLDLAAAFAYVIAYGLERL